MSTAKNSEELEKQYREYRAQFEAWKEKNKNSVGTEAYIAYVNQFQDWERDVEKRRAKIRETVEREAADRERQRQEEEERANREREEKEKKEREAAEQAAAEAAAYAQHQQIYMAHHQAEMQKEQEIKAQQALQQAQMQQQFSQPPPNMVQQHTQSSVDEINAHTVMQEMVSIVMGAGAGVIGTDKPTVYQQAPPTQTAATGPPPTLWGNSKMIYDPKDPLWARWGPRAAPCHMPPPPLPPSVPVPCWFVMDQMKEKQMMMAPSAAAPPPPFVSS